MGYVKFLVYFKDRFTKKDLQNLFLVIAFPIHAWSIIQVLRDVGLVYDQQGGGILTGYIAYSMVFAFFETAVFFILFFLLGHLLPKRWAGEKTLAILSQWGIVLSLWGVANQVYFILLESPPEFLSWVLLRVAHRQQLGFTILLVTVVLSVVLPLILTTRYEKIKNGTIAIIERISLLSILYLVFDFISFIIIVFRNIT